jgi:hypothetical protein
MALVANERIMVQTAGQLLEWATKELPALRARLATTQATLEQSRRTLAKR